MDNKTIIDLSAQIVCAHVSNNTVAAADLPQLLHSVFGALVTAGAPAAVVEAPLVPAVPVRSSVKHDAIACLECGAKLKVLKRHLTSEHGVTAAEYRARWGLPADYPLAAPLYSQSRSELAKKLGLGRKAIQLSPPAEAPITNKGIRERKKLKLSFAG